jgi:hypothetical protein
LKVNGTAIVRALATEQQHRRQHHAHLQVGAIRRPDIRPQVSERAQQRTARGGHRLEARGRMRRVHEFLDSVRFPAHIGAFRAAGTLPCLRNRYRPGMCRISGPGCT